MYKRQEYVGIKSLSYELAEETTEDEILKLIENLNADASGNGILCQLPLPKHIDEDKVIDAIDPKKDVDGFSPQLSLIHIYSYYRKVSYRQ